MNFFHFGWKIHTYKREFSKDCFSFRTHQSKIILRLSSNIWAEWPLNCILFQKLFVFRINIFWGENRAKTKWAKIFKGSLVMKLLSLYFFSLNGTSLLLFLWAFPLCAQGYFYNLSASNRIKYLILARTQYFSKNLSNFDRKTLFRLILWKHFFLEGSGRTKGSFWTLEN